MRVYTRNRILKYSPDLWVQHGNTEKRLTFMYNLNQTSTGKLLESPNLNQNLEIEKRPRMKKSQVKIGMKVTCKSGVAAYSSSAWSSQSSAPRPIFSPGMVGMIVAVDVPSVRREHISFCCVDFINSDGEPDRCALLYDNIVPVRDPQTCCGI